MKLRLIALLGLLALVLASCGGATPQASGPSEGIQVHGDWTIDIYNADGTLDEHVEFENALTREGAAVIAGLLTGDRGSVGQWAIEFGAVSSPPLGSIDPIVANYDSNSTGPFVEVAGSTSVSADGQIERVRTLVGTCGVRSSECRASHAGGVVSPKEMTAKTFDPADYVSVSAGQTVDVRVEILIIPG